jgi:hypothetical protein
MAIDHVRVYSGIPPAVHTAFFSRDGSHFVRLHLCFSQVQAFSTIKINDKANRGF